MWQNLDLGTLSTFERWEEDMGDYLTHHKVLYPVLNSQIDGLRRLR